MIKNHRLAEARFDESPNVGGPLKAPTLLVIHYTGGRNASSAASWLCNKAAKASAHLIIGRGGELIQLVPFDRVAWHAGHSVWRGRPSVNSYSIGIELDNPGFVKRVGGRWRALALGIDYNDEDVVEDGNKGWVAYTPLQLKRCDSICRELLQEYSSLNDVAGHADVALPKGRKLDPGGAFGTDALRLKLFGRA